MRSTCTKSVPKGKLTVLVPPERHCAGGFNSQCHKIIMIIMFVRFFMLTQTSGSYFWKMDYCFQIQEGERIVLFAEFAAVAVHLRLFQVCKGRFPA